MLRDLCTEFILFPFTILTIIISSFSMLQLIVTHAALPDTFIIPALMAYKLQVFFTYIFKPFPFLITVIIKIKFR